MKKLLTIAIVITSLFYGSINSWAALGAATAWEVRTTGSSNNGGGFDSGVAVPGTDYSQQDAAQDSGTDLACADGDAATPSVTSATHNFVEADEGNIINITETGDGFTLGRYVITNTAANAATLDRACGTDGAKTGGDWYYGGGVDHPNTISTVVVAGNTIYIQNGTYQKVGANTYVLTISVSGGVSTPIKWIGYITNHATIPTGTDRPYIDGNSAATNCLVATGKARNSFWHLRFANATGTALKDFGKWNDMHYSKISASATGTNDPGAEGVGHMFNCEITTPSGIGISSNRFGGFLVGCYIHDCGGSGVSASRGWVSIGSVSESNSGHGFTTGSTYDWVWSFNSVAYNNSGAASNGFNFTGNETWYTLPMFYNNISTDNGKYGFSRTNTTDFQLLFDYNCYNGNATAGLNNITAGVHDTTADPLFTDDAGGDFTLQSGSPCLNVGFPSAIPGATGAYKWNIGVDQDDNTAAGGGGGAGHLVIQ